jgi:hypothetical protein
MIEHRGMMGEYIGSSKIMKYQNEIFFNYRTCEDISKDLLSLLNTI